MNFSWTEWLPFRRWRLVGVVDDADAIPDRLPPRGVVLVGPPDRPKWAAFDCPCGVGHRILLNTDPARRPAWRVTLDGRHVTLAPSVDFVGATKRCHYFVRHGRIQWVRDDAPGRGSRGD